MLCFVTIKVGRHVVRNTHPAQLPDCSFCELVHQHHRARARAQGQLGCDFQSTLPATGDVIPRLYVYSCRLCTLFNLFGRGVC